MSSTCGICLDDFEEGSMYKLHICHCSFCQNCLTIYFQFMIDNGHSRIYCPSFKCCVLNNPIDIDEINSLVSPEHKQKYDKLLNNNVNIKETQGDNLLEIDTQARCPFCDYIFEVNTKTSSNNEIRLPDTRRVRYAINPKYANDDLIYQCTNCLERYCRTCKEKAPQSKVVHGCSQLSESVLQDLNIKKCPNCNYLIQLEGGCAQMHCRNCHYIFCWHCLKSLNNDFLLFHYDSGPCKNKLGHSRLSIFFNRVQTISICLGVGILMVLASPVILITLPCLLTSKCGWCCRRRRRKSMPTAV